MLRTKQRVKKMLKQRRRFAEFKIDFEGGVLFRHIETLKRMELSMMPACRSILLNSLSPNSSKSIFRLAVALLVSGANRLVAKSQNRPLT